MSIDDEDYISVVHFSMKQLVIYGDRYLDCDELLLLVMLLYFFYCLLTTPSFKKGVLQQNQLI